MDLFFPRDVVAGVGCSCCCCGCGGDNDDDDDEEVANDSSVCTLTSFVSIFKGDMGDKGESVVVDDDDDDDDDDDTVVFPSPFSFLSVPFSAALTIALSTTGGGTGG